MESYLKAAGCSCGREHIACVDEVLVGKGVMGQIPALLEKYGSRRPFLLADTNTWNAAGAALGELLEQKKIPFGSYVFPQQHLEPDEKAVGSAVMHYDNTCDLIVGIGSGVINDIGKILSSITGNKYIILATAPSMDGYASGTSSMAMDGVKVSLNSRCADVIVGDTDILCKAPEHMLSSGLGDMLAKYVSIAEWRIAHLITGEYYCEEVAQLIRGAVKACTDNAYGLLRREPEAVEAVFRGLVIGGMAMAYAGVSRPASGVEHYFSHVWDMRALEFGLEVQLHGIQCATATYVAAKLYERIENLTPDWGKAHRYVESFNYNDWSSQLKEFLGSSADAMIALEAKEGKYRKDTHPARFERIRENWEEILNILHQELPEAEEIGKLLDVLKIPRDPAAFGVDTQGLRQTFRATKDIRDKYVLSRLAWDLGVLEELCQCI